MICRMRAGTKGVLTGMGLPSSTVEKIVSFSYCSHVPYAVMVTVTIPNSRDQKFLNTFLFNFPSAFFLPLVPDKNGFYKSMHPKSLHASDM